MRKFEFRLQRVLDYREMEEDWAKQDYLARQIERIKAEGELQTILDNREAMLKQPNSTVEDRLALQNALGKSDDDERAQHAVIEVLMAEEGKALTTWTEKRRDLKALIKLRDEAQSEWRAESERFEQNELDEWTNTRRKAA